MKKSLYVLCVIAIFLSGCSTTSAPTTTAQPTATEIPPTEIPTVAPTPEPTALPGSLTIPVDSLSPGIPWLQLDPDAVPMVVYIGINNRLAPFNNVDVRRAFAAATDREAIAAIAERLYFENVRPATSVTPSETIGRDLYEEVGVPYDPAAAREALAAAGYADTSTFPEITLLASTRGSAAPGFYTQVSDALKAMWEEHLGITVNVQVMGDFGAYNERLRTDPPHMYFLGWGADINDPDNFLSALLHSESEFNFGQFASVQFDSLLFRAASETIPVDRQLFYLQAEQIVVEDLVGVIPLFHAYFYRVN